MGRFGVLLGLAHGLAGLGLGSLLYLSGGEAAAQAPAPGAGPPPGFAYSTNYEALPAGSGLRVRALDNSPNNQRLVRTVREAMQRAGRPASDVGAFVLTLETEVNPIGAGFPRERRDVDPQGHYYQFNVPLGRRPGDPPPAVARQQQPTPQGSVQFSMTLTVDDGTGRRYWLGQAYYTGSPDDQETAFNVMARTLVEQFGRTVRQRSFRIQ
jgi:hypothetical protein